MKERTNKNRESRKKDKNEGKKEGKKEDTPPTAAGLPVQSLQLICKHKNKAAGPPVRSTYQLYFSQTVNIISIIRKYFSKIPPPVSGSGARHGPIT